MTKFNFIGCEGWKNVKIKVNLPRRFTRVRIKSDRDVDALIYKSTELKPFTIPELTGMALLHEVKKRNEN